MIVLSLFDGMSCGQLALSRVGIEPTKYFASEIDKYAIKVTQTNFPDTIQLGDVTKLSTRNGNLLVGEVEYKIDLLIGGFPCQSFSFSGKGLGFEDDRGKLFFEVVRLLKELNPRYFLFENVKMKKEHEAYINSQIGVSPTLINSSLVSAQNRQRLYWTNIPNVTQPVDLGITFKDIMEKEATNVYRVTDKMMAWINKDEKRRNKLKIYNKDTNEKMQMLEASHCKGISNQRCFMIEDPLACRLVGRRLDENGTRKDYDKTLKIEQIVEINENECKTNTLTTVQKDNVILYEIPHGYNKGGERFIDKFPTLRAATKSNYAIKSELVYRYITPIECERLQTIPDNYTSSVSNTQRYKMLGNGWTVDIIAHIFKGMLD